jgi:ubiquinone/menaquinone biosynthesis C-methylase UbiE
VHDLNQQPQLPFADRQFDAVICTVSVEYLTQPLAVMHEIARVTRPGGIVVMTFSDRWFPTKVVDIWTEMHPFERQGLVLDYFLHTGCFSHLHTESTQGLPRPKDDPHIREKSLSDPVFAVWGQVSG